MPWVEIFVALMVTHVAGDYLVQTDWQAMHKRGGLGRDAVARRALLSHTATYTLTYLPALIWLSSDLGAGVLWLAALIGLPHMLQDDGRVVTWWMRYVKHVDVKKHPLVGAAVDQAMHTVALFVAALAAGV